MVSTPSFLRSWFWPLNATNGCEGYCCLSKIRYHYTRLRKIPCSSDYTFISYSGPFLHRYLSCFVVVTQLFLVSWTFLLLLRFTKISCEPHDFFYITRISKRKDEVVKRRQNVKQLAGERRQELQQSQILQNFKRDTQEVPGFFLSYMLSIQSSFFQIVYSNYNNRPFYNRRQN